MPTSETAAPVADSSPLRYSLAGLVVGLLLGFGAWYLLAGVAGGDGVAVADAQSDAAAPAGPPAAPVDVVAAVETIAAEPVQLLGSVAPVRESLVASEVEGLVAEVHVDEGMAVNAGDVMVRLRTTTLRQQLAAARAARDETEARRARAATDFDRLRQLLARKAISQREFDQAVADRDALVQGVTRLDAEATRLEELLGQATILAPFSGSITQVDVEVGEWVGQGDQIAALVDLSDVEVGVQVAERYISAITPGFPVTVRLDALPRRQYEGRVKAIVPQALPEARTFPVLVGIRNPEGLIKGGMAARVSAQLGSPQPATLVSKDAIVRRGDQVLVFRVRPQDDSGKDVGVHGVIEQVAVQTGPARGQWRVIHGPVHDGDLIVVRGNERVFPGQPVAVAAVRELPVPTADPAFPIAIDPRSER